MPTKPLKKSAPQPVIGSPGALVLQWLTYAFWGWTLLALSFLTFIVIYNFINQADMSEAVPYVLAATVVLLPISFICDWFYSKHEGQKKQGASMIVMVIHAVVFALFGIGALIASLFALIQLGIANGESSGSIASFISFLIIAVLYGLTFIRTLMPLQPVVKIARIYSLIMVVIAAVFIVLSIIGPLAQSLITKNDRRIEQHLQSVKNGVDMYIVDNKKMPAHLSDTSLDPDAQALVEEQLVRLKDDGYNATDKSYRYQLCVTYAERSDRTYAYYPVPEENRDGYLEYLNVPTNHPKGEMCYKLKFISLATDSPKKL